MGIEHFPLSLMRAQLELQLRLGKAVQERSQRLLDQASSAVGESVAAADAAAQQVDQAQDWQKLAGLPSQALWEQVQRHLEEAQGHSQRAVKDHAAFAQAVQEALQDWQKNVTNSMTANQGELVNTDPAKQWAALWSAALPQAQVPKI